MAVNSDLLRIGEHWRDDYARGDTTLPERVESTQFRVTHDGTVITREEQLSESHNACVMDPGLPADWHWSPGSIMSKKMDKWPLSRAQRGCIQQSVQWHRSVSSNAGSIAMGIGKS